MGEPSLDSSSCVNRIKFQNEIETYQLFPPLWKQRLQSRIEKIDRHYVECQRNCWSRITPPYNVESLCSSSSFTFFFVKAHLNCGHESTPLVAKNWLSIKPYQVNRSSVTLTKIWWRLVTWPRYTSLVNENLKFVRSPHRNRHSPCRIPFRLLAPLTGWFLVVWARTLKILESC